MLGSEAISIWPHSQPSASSTASTSTSTSVCSQNLTELRVSKLQTIPVLPGHCYDYFDDLTKTRSHSFVFTLDQTRQVSIDIANHRLPNLIEEILQIRRIQVILRSEAGEQGLFAIVPGDRCRETLMLDRGRYLLELKTATRQPVRYALKLTAMRWLLFGYCCG